MVDILLTIDKYATLQEIAKTTAYAAAKKDDDDTAAERIYTVDEDAEMLERFWREAKETATQAVKEMLTGENEIDGIYRIRLRQPNQYPQQLTDSVNRSLFSFFVMSILSKWYILTNKEDVEGCTAQAAAYMEDVIKKLYSRRRPVRPVEKRRRREKK